MYLWYQSIFQVKIAAMVTKCKETIHANTFRFYRIFKHSEFSILFWRRSCMIITQIGRKQLGGHRACLGDIMQNIAKMGQPRTQGPFTTRLETKASEN